MEGIVVAILSMILVYALLSLFPWKRRQVSKSDEHNEEPQVEQDDNISGNHNFHPHHHHKLWHGKDEVSNDADNVQDGGIIIHEFDDLHISNHKECVQDVVRKLYDATKYMLADKISVDQISEDPKKDVEQSVATNQAIVEHEKDDKLEKRCVGHYNNQQKILLVGEGDFSFSSCLATAFLSASNLTATSLDSRGNYSMNHKILLVGEGDFSFASCLANSFPSASNITATSLDSRDTVIRKYSNGKKNLVDLKDLGALVLHKVDAHTLDEHPRLRHKQFDRIVFNFPHAGGIYGSCSETASWYIERHRRVVSGFFEEAKYKLTGDGEIHVTHKTCHPFNKWNIVELAEDAGLMLISEAKFDRSDYPGYMNKRGYGSKWNKTFRVGECCTFMFCTRW